MRLWHQILIHHLDDELLYAQHRDCCALRGERWGMKCNAVDYVFKYDRSHLYQYHLLVMYEMNNRHISFSQLRHFSLSQISGMWFNRLYRGENMPADTLITAGIFVHKNTEMIYPEHNDEYLRECLLNLQAKGSQLVNDETIEHMLIELDVNQ